MNTAMRLKRVSLWVLWVLCIVCAHGCSERRTSTERKETEAAGGAGGAQAERAPGCVPLEQGWNADGSIGPGCFIAGEEKLADVTIHPGTTFKFKRLGYMRTRGTFTAVGSEQAPIIFESLAEQPAAGDWGCLRISASMESQLQHVIVRHAGAECVSSSRVGIELDDAIASFEHVTVEDIAGDALRMSYLVHGIAAFDDYVARRVSGHSLVVEADAVDAVRGAISLDEDERFIEVEGELMRYPVTLHNVGYAYRLRDRMQINADMTIEPGVVIAPQKLWFVDSSLYAVGTQQAPIVWTSAQDEPQAGDWGCLRFSDAPSVVAHNIFEYGGDCELAGMWDVPDGEPIVAENVSFRHAQFALGLSCDDDISPYCALDFEDISVRARCFLSETERCP